MGYVKIKTCKSEKNENTCIESSILINGLYTNTLAYLNSINASFPEMSNFASLKPIIFIPSENAMDDYKYYTAFGLNSSNYGFGEYNKEGVYKATYVELTEEQLNTILPYTSNAGLSNKPLIRLMIGELVTYSTEYTFRGNYLIQPEHMDEVLELVKDNPRKVITDPYAFAQIKE